jgi:hypothetical protein
MKNKMFSTFVMSLWLVNSAFASMVSDVPEPYEDAWHDTAQWQQVGNDNLVDDGVWWSVDGGATWGHNGLTVGDEVTFRFDLWTSGSGRHDYNQLKAWVDWNQDFDWANDSSEIVLEERVFQRPNNPHPVPGISTLVSSAYLITEDMIGDLWLRARAQCNHVPFGTMTPYDGLWQGEVEDWKLTVNAADVPEPQAILLLGVGLLGLLGARMRRA